MKNYCAWILCLAGTAVGVRAAEQQTKPPTPDRVAVVATEIGKPQIVARWTDGRVWQRINTQTLTNGTIVSRTNRWTDLASGMHYWDVNHWKESRAEILITPDGAEARQGPHKVHLAGNINSAGAITITSADNKTLRSHVVGLAYTDLATGESVLIATVRDSVGQLFPPNQVLYPAAFTGIAADLRYTYTRQGFEQDVILRENPPLPSDYGLNNETTALEVWTEFNAPEPEKRQATIAGLSDETLSFGKLHIARGGAFAVDAPDSRMSAAPVGKTWLPANGRQYLIESVRHSAVGEELDKLPRLQAAIRRAPGNQVLAAKTASRVAWLNGLEPRRAAAPTPVRMAVDKSLIKSGPGLVLDYIIYGGDTNDFTFQTDTTYLVSGSLNIFGTATFEGGTVLKYATTNDVLIQFWGAFVMKTDPYRPAIFTSQNDKTVGQDFTAAGSPMKYFGAIACTAIPHDFAHLRISYAKYGLHTSAPMKLRDAQFTECDRALYTEFGAADIDNVLFYNSGRVFAGSKYTNSVRHVTINQCAQLSEDWANTNYSRIWLTNSLLVNVTNMGAVSLTTNFTVATTSNIFQAVGAGAHYLADPSPYRDAGTTNLPPTLAARLRKTTTYPPLVIAPMGYYGITQTLFPRSSRDTDLPDLGYHYNPLDYTFAFAVITNATLTVDPGTAIGMFNPTNSTGYGLWLNQNGRLISQGKAEAKVQITHYPTVQEMANTNWAGPFEHLIYSTAATAGSQELNCRFTEFTVMASSDPAVNLYGNINLFYGVDNSAALSFTDCQFHAGNLQLFTESSFTATNTLFNRNYNSWYLLGSTTNYYYNCTFHGGYHEAGTWTTNQLRLHDTLFVGTTIYNEGSVSSHIGYVGSGRLSPTNANDRVLTNLIFQTGTLGYFYIPSNALVNAGSRNATNAGLYHYTMLTNNVKEANTVVDMGFHYVATDANGTPLDYDGDGVPDYWEDQNGNGSKEITEVDWLDDDKDTDNDGVSDGLELLLGRNPLGGTLTDSNNILNLRVFTPLK